MTAHLDHPPLGAEIIAAVSVHRDFAAHMDLMMGIHPTEHRHLTELEEGASHWVGLLASKATISDTDEFSRALALWRDHWPNWSPSNEGIRFAERNVEERWQFLLPHCSPVAAAYLFRPTAPHSPETHEAAQREYREVFDNVKRRADASLVAKDRITWTVSLFPSGVLRRTFEEVCGLTDRVKSRLGIDDHVPAFLRRYVTAHDEPLEELVTPRQFEHLIADVYRADGWNCHVTRYSKDGDVDIEATRLEDGCPTAILIQVKRNRSSRSRRGPARPVGVGEVKAFAATVRAEGKDSGVLVTSSHVTRDARRWASSKGQRVASLAFLDGPDVRARLFEISRRLARGDIASYVLKTHEALDGACPTRRC